MVKLAPSVLAADFLRLREQVEEADRAGADRLHLDVMDGRFVPNISFGFPIVKAVRQATTKPVETHLMIVEPERYVEEFIRVGSDTIIVHQEAAPHLDRVITHIKQLGKRAGVALNPSTPVVTLEHVIELLDVVLIMTVNPGFGGQRFIPYTMSKVRQARQLVDRRNPACEIEVDGGIDAYTVAVAVQAGANVLVAGSSVFGAKESVTTAMQRLQAAVAEG